MTPDLLMNAERLRALIEDLRALPAETPWVEFKESNAEPDRIGKLVSALANAASLAEQDFAYGLWGIRDHDHAIVGRIGSATTRLADHPERLRHLWAKLQPYAWESGLAAQFLSGDEVLSRLDYAGYFDLTQQPLPDNRQGIFEKLAADNLIRQDAANHWNITNLGAILFAKDLHKFGSSLARKAVRFVAYDGTSRADTVTHRQDHKKGYANGFQGLMDYLAPLISRNEWIEKAFRKDRPLYPSIALRELIANALIHQDMTVTGAGPSIEMFRDRLDHQPGETIGEPGAVSGLSPTLVQ